MYIRSSLDSSPPEQNDCHFADDIFKCNFVIEKFYILIKISLKLVPKGLADQIHWRIYAALGGDELTSFCTHNVGCAFSHDLSPSNTISVPGLGVRPGTISDHGLGVRRNSSSRRVGAVASKDFTRFKKSVPLALTFAPTGNVKVGASSRLKKQSMDEPATSKDIDLQSLNSCHAEFFLKQNKIYLHFQSAGKWCRWLKYFCMKNKDLPVLQSQYYCCRWPGDARSQGISWHGIDFIFPEYSGFSTKRVKTILP